MALSATIFKAQLQVSDLDRQYYASHALTVARHPSETDARMMVRILAFALHADPDLAFTRGISTDDEPDLWRHRPDGTIDLWIELGQPDEKRLRRACGRAARVLVYTYQDQPARPWWARLQATVARFDNLGVRRLPEPAVRELAGLARRTMDLTCTVQEGEAWLADGERSVHLVPEMWKP